MEKKWPRKSEENLKSMVSWKPSEEVSSRERVNCVKRLLVGKADEV